MDANVTVRMSQDLYDQLSADAQTDRRPMSEFARLLIEEALLARQGRHAAGNLAVDRDGKPEQRERDDAGHQGRA